MAEHQPARVLFVLGSGRSGSTIVEQVLGQVTGVQACGELRYLWQRGMVENRLCGCGQPFHECPHWSAVLAAAGIGPADGEGLARRQRRRLRTRGLPALLLGTARGRGGDRDRGVLGAMYATLGRGSAVVVDSSKLASYGDLLRSLPGVDVRVLHLVRDPRATAFSWQRRRSLPDFGDERVMQQMPPAKTAAMWLFWNALSELLWARDRGRYLRLRYEDFVADPETATRRVLEHTGHGTTELPFTDPHTALIAPTHTVSGNPARHRGGAVHLVLDEEWRQAMSPRDRWLVTVLTLPLVLRYRYRLRGGPR